MPFVVLLRRSALLALATTLSALVNMLLLLWFLRRKIGSFGGRGIISSGVKSLLASLPMCLTVYYACLQIDWSQSGHKVIKFFVLGGAVAIGIVVYAVAARVLRSNEALEMVSILRRKLGRKTS